ncbi:hypothetical protein D9756_005263 [Leucocoprinus leucothites]|uniref:Uncharacterized protein n=1 Tax=Leucocoprinus leucothites TaxID=201217 RepID=A0A8H5D790_9AGAR|nr:hypothetical protein D9756_005263 [Leucoagaricus leucothites]
MGLVSSSQSGSPSSSVKSKARSRLSKPLPSELPKPLLPPPTESQPSHPPQTVHHRRVGSAAGVTGITTSTKLKERQAWYRHLKRSVPASERKAKKSAFIIRSLIVGQPTTASPKVTKASARPQLTKIKSSLVEPKSANRIIAELRTLSPLGDSDATIDSGARPDHKGASGTVGPIHAVCFEHPDAEADQLYFSKSADEGDDLKLDLTSLSDIGSAWVDRLSDMINDIQVIDLIRTPDLGLGQPGDGPGILAGAVPTPETVIQGIEQITPQLMALGFAIGKSILPDHQGIFPPTDRMSVLTYWWGLELVLPPPSLAYLSSAHSVSGSVMNFLTALSMVNNGVREILPFVRYISQFVDFEFNQIKNQDRGKGVVCAATWIMPAALVPRPWDFADPPIPSINPPKDKRELAGPPDSNPRPTPAPAPAPAPMPSPANGMPFLTPVPMTSA